MTRLTYALRHSFQPDIACSEKFVHVVWQDYRDDPEHLEVYYTLQFMVRK